MRSCRWSLSWSDPSNKKPVQLAAERVSVESRFSCICRAPASCRAHACNTRIKSALVLKIRPAARLVNSAAVNPVTSARDTRDAAMLDPDIRRLLDTVFEVPDSAAPSIAQLRAAAEEAPKLLGGEPEVVASIRDLHAPGSAGAVPVRVY